jgi:hypothetical protein
MLRSRVECARSPQFSVQFSVEQIMHQSRHQPQAASDRDETLYDNASRIGEHAMESAHAAGKEASRLAGEVSAAAREHPYAALAIAAGLAFAVGALWKMGSRPQSRLDALMARLPDVPNANALWPRGWR